MAHMQLCRSDTYRPLNVTDGPTRETHLLTSLRHWLRASVCAFN